MSYIGPRGIPRRHFMGGPPGWTHADREDALAWMLRERRRCSSCGFHPDDDPNEWRAAHRTCPGCAKLETARKTAEQRAKAKTGEVVDTPGGFYALELVPPPRKDVADAESTR